MSKYDEIRRAKCVMYKSALGDLSVKEFGVSENGKLTGYLSTWDIDAHNEAFRAGAFSKSIMQNRSRGWPLLKRHARAGALSDDVIGKITHAKEDDKGLFIEAEFSPDDDSQKIRQKVAAGHIGQMSVGFRPLQYEFRQDYRGSKVDTLFTEAAIVEGTITPFPANENAMITSAKSLRESLMKMAGPVGDLIAKFEDRPELIENLLELAKKLDDMERTAKQEYLHTGSLPSVPDVGQTAHAIALEIQSAKNKHWLQTIKGATNK